MLCGEAAAGDFVQAAAKGSGGELASVILTGSYARGEATPSSNVDLWRVFRNLKAGHLLAVGEVVSPDEVLHHIG